MYRPKLDEQKMDEPYSVIIAERGEYGRRLVRYLERTLPSYVRICHFTTAEAFLNSRGKAEYYLIEEELYHELEGRWELSPGEKGQVLILSDRDGPGRFCIYDTPSGIREWMEAGIRDSCRVLSAGDCRITAVYSPLYEEDLQKIAMSFMEEGDLFLGFEDLGPVVSRRANVSDLCYFIRLHSEEILDTMEELCDRSTGIFLLESPDMFFYLRELSIEDYKWFFDRIRRSGRYRNIMLAIGNGFISRPEILPLLDRMIMLDSSENSRRHALCTRLDWILRSDAIAYRGEIVRVYKEEVM